jgi:3-isopropylmalate dehydrogenase
MMLRYSFNLNQEAALVEESVAHVVKTGLLTADVGGTANTTQVTDGLIEAIKNSLKMEKI